MTNSASVERKTLERTERDALKAGRPGAYFSEFTATLHLSLRESVHFVHACQVSGRTPHSGIPMRRKSSCYNAGQPIEQNCSPSGIPRPYSGASPDIGPAPGATGREHDGMLMCSGPESRRRKLRLECDR
jgi:hypothetical protein